MTTMEQWKRRGELTRAAMAWWRTLRPIDWGTSEHIARPGVNCKSDAERRLAKSCAALKAVERMQ